MTTDLWPSDVLLTRDLAVAVRFVDPFTGQAVRVPMSVSIPALQWSAVRSERDATYRFSLANLPTVGGVPQFPAWAMGTHALEVNVPGELYAMMEPLTVTIPPAAPHVPPAPADYRVDLPLWPTRALRSPPGETAVVGRLASSGGAAVGGWKVTLFQGGAPPPGAPYARANAAGEFLFRLPGLKRGSSAIPTASLGVEVRDPADVVQPVAPGTITVPVGVMSMVALTVP